MTLKTGSGFSELSSFNTFINNVGGSTTINDSGGISDSDTTIIVTDGSVYSDNQTIKIENEYILIGTVSGNNLLNCLRGAYDSTVVSHSDGTNIYGVFIGQKELNSYPDVMVSFKCDTTGVLYFDFSNNSTDWDTFPTSGYTVSSNSHQFQTGVKSRRYFRVRFENSSSSATTSLRIYTYYGSSHMNTVLYGQDDTGSYINVKQDTSAFRTTTNLGGTQINNGAGYTSGETTSLIVDDTSSFPSSGYIYIGSEFIKYASKTSTTFDTLTRGEFGTTASSISDVDVVGGVYSSGILTLDGYTEVATKVLCSNVGQMRFQWFTDSAGNDNIRTLAPPYANIDTYDYLAAPNFGPYVLYIFGNKQNSATTDFYFETEFYTKAISAQVLTLNSTLLGGMTSNVTRSILVGQQEGGTTYQNVSTTSANELLTNTLASNRTSRSLYSISGVSANTYALLVDLNDTTNYPHSQTNYLNIDTFSCSVSFSSNTAQARVKIGVITRIDGVNADISFLISKIPSVQSANDSILLHENYQPSSIQCNVNSGILVGSVTNDKSTNDTNINTGITLSSPTGNVTPAVGDIIIFFGYVADQYDATVSIIYHSQ